jgi:hypothetical protein
MCTLYRAVAAACIVFDVRFLPFQQAIQIQMVVCAVESHLVLITIIVSYSQQYTVQYKQQGSRHMLSMLK